MKRDLKGLGYLKEREPWKRDDDWKVRAKQREE